MKLSIELGDGDYAELEKAAGEDLRTARAQAAWMIREALANRSASQWIGHVFREHVGRPTPADVAPEGVADA